MKDSAHIGEAPVQPVARVTCAHCGAGLKDDEKPGPDCRKCVQWKKDVRDAKTMGLI